MKIVLATHFPHDTASPRGGVEAVSLILAKTLATFEDLDVHVVTFDGQCPEMIRESWKQVTVHRLPGLKGSTMFNATGKGRKRLCAYLESLRPDVVHAHDTYGIMVKGLNMPRVFTIHGFIYGDTLVSRKKCAWLRSKVWKWIETSSWADQPYIISISPYVRERLSGIAKGVIYDIDNPIDASFFELERAEEKNILFSAATICPRKNTLNLAKAFSTMVNQGIDAQLRLAGPIVNQKYGDELKAYIKDNNLEDKVILLGQIPETGMREELSRASVFGLVSLEENSPMGIEEAMAVGMPIITSNRCGMPYMVQHEGNGCLVNPCDLNDITRHLVRLFENKPLRAQMSALSRQIAQERFHPVKVATRTRRVYEEACASCRVV